MATAVFTSSSISRTNADLKRGNTVTIVFKLTSGALPTAGCTLNEVTANFSNIAVYSDKNSPGLKGNFFNLYLDKQSGAQTVFASSVRASLIDFAGGSMSFEVSGGQSTTSNVLNIRAGSTVTLTIDYTSAPKTIGYLSSITVAQGSNIGMELEISEETYCHTVQWYRDDTHTQTQNLGEGETSTEITIPNGSSSWPTGTAYAYLRTYADSSYSRLIGENTYQFTITIDPETVVPDAGTLSVELVQSESVPSSWGVYVKGYSRAKLTLTGASAGSNAAFKSIELSCGGQQKATQSETTFETDVITETNRVTCSAQVSNTYGNSAEATDVIINVYDYYTPIFKSVSAFRCTSDGTPSDTGAYIGVAASVSVASVNNKNSLIALQAQYAPSGSSSWSTAVSITNNGTTIIGGDIASTDSSVYRVQITSIDGIQNQAGKYSQVVVTALTSSHVIFCKDGGLNVSFGMQGTRERAVQINGEWDIYHGDNIISGTVPIKRGGTGGVTAETAFFNLISSISNTSKITPAHDDKVPILDIDGNTAGYFTVTDLMTAMGFSSDGALSIAAGGTGGTTAAEAKENLAITPEEIGAAPTEHEHEAAQITSGELSEERLPFKVAWGEVTLSGASWQDNISYGKTFSSPPAVVATYETETATTNPLKTRDVGTSKFGICMNGSGSGTRTVHWIAIGT